jgi:hypothetical protein
MELYNLYSPPDMMIKSGRMRWAEHVALVNKMRNRHKILVGKTEKKRQLGRCWHRV